MIHRIEPYVLNVCHFRQDDGFRETWSGVKKALIESSGSPIDNNAVCELLHLTRHTIGTTYDLKIIFEVQPKSSDVLTFPSPMFSKDALDSVVAYFHKKNLSMIPEFNELQTPENLKPLSHRHEDFPATENTPVIDVQTICWVICRGILAHKKMDINPLVTSIHVVLTPASDPTGSGGHFVHTIA